MRTDRIATLVTTPSDREVAADLRKRLEAALGTVVDLMVEADSHGIQINWSIGRNDMGRLRLIALNILRPL